MPFDAIFLSAVAAELAAELDGARVDKIQQPQKDEIRIVFRAKDGAKRLLISASPSGARAHLTATSRENPAAPPMFCMLLRKHLTNARLASVAQAGLERVLTLTFAASGEMGDRSEKRLILELYGRQPNVILVGDDGHVIDCLRKVNPEDGGRQTLPGLFYKPPEMPEKKNPMEISRGEFIGMLDRAGGVPCDKWLSDNFFALSPLICREIVFRASGETDKRADTLTRGECEAFADEMESLRRLWSGKAFRPVLLEKDYSFMEIKQYGAARPFEIAESFSALLDKFYGEREEAAAFSQKQSALQKSVGALRDKLVKKLSAQREELLGTKNRERLRQFGDILSAHMGDIGKGQKKAVLPDFYSEDGAAAEIPLKEDLTPQQNTARYYKEYSRQKSAEKHLSALLGAGEAELHYFDSVSDAAARAGTEAELDEIRAELESGGYIRSRQKNEKARAKKPLPFIEYKTADGFTVLVGRNNAQNDLLTTKFAEKSDIWFHVKDAPGSHVILRAEGRKPTDAAKTYAAGLAAAHSSLAGGGKAQVDYTEVRFVKKPAGAKPGMVIYDKYETAVADAAKSTSRK